MKRVHINEAADKLEKHIQEMDDGSYIEFDVPEFSNTVLDQLNQLRLQGKLCDIIVHIQGQPFRAHKAVLAASSPYFRDHSALSTMSGLSISVIKSPEVFEQLLAFCYTGHMSLQLKDIISFLTAASFLQMQAIIDKCTQILESIHSKISIPVSVCSPGKGDSQTSGNGVNDSNLFVNPTQISPPYYSRQSQAGHEVRFELPGKTHRRGRQQPEEGQSDRGSSDSVSEHDARMEGEMEQVELIGKDGQVTDVHVKIEKTERPTYSDSSSAGDDGYHTELVDGEQVLAVSVGSYGPVIQSAAYSYSGQSTPCFVNLSSSSPSRSLLSGYRGGRARVKRPLGIPAGVLSRIKPGSEDSESVVGPTGLENDVRERSLRSQWYPYNERLICIYCGKTFNQKGSLDRHMRLHMGITPFVCKFCGKKYTRKDQLEYHIRGHTDNKPFHCQICGKCFPFQGTLNQHLRKKHMGASEVTNHIDSPETTEGSSGQKDTQETSEGMAFEAQYAEEAPANEEESSKCSPEEAQASRCDF
ncbi:zinc finger and BTB domain-containing protein 34 isoform X1 [Trematomus bernacchii]|uniref:zinc finger and BTB domain-containing protein 34 isoform X1 n=1 Tax=Trematomus bernacchii TaxID=40690 RepID=UPI00146DADD7|nr:zinc finger and BTB domain-containing protein 34 isoform X1 [Trematomus bernacchii]